jgi:hypothetical protein
MDLLGLGQGRGRPWPWSDIWERYDRKVVVGAIVVT